MTSIADYMLAAHIGYVNASIRGERPLPFRPLATLPAHPSGTRSPRVDSPLSAGAGFYANTAGLARQETDPFDRTWPQRAPMTEADGQQYEREEMQDGRFAVAD